MRKLLIFLVFALVLSIEAQQTKTWYKGPAPTYTYSEVSDKLIDGVKTLTVKVSGPVTGQQAKEIASAVRDKYPGESLNVKLYMAGTENLPGSPWATVQVGKGGSVELKGHMTEKVDKETGGTAKPEKDGRTLVGNWSEPSGDGMKKVSVFEKNGKMILETVDENGNKTESNVSAKRTTTGVKIETGDASGKYYLLNNFGDLEERDGSGLVTKLNKGEDPTVPISAGKIGN